MKHLQMLATSVIVFCITNLYILYSSFHRLFATGSSVAGSFSAGRRNFRAGVAGQMGQTFTLANWMNGIELLSLATLIMLLTFRPSQSYPKWFKWLVSLAALLLVAQIVFLFIHPAGVGANFRHFNSGQFGQSGNGNFPQQSGSASAS